jgi:hypothetical protein
MAVPVPAPIARPTTLPQHPWDLYIYIYIYIIYLFIILIHHMGSETKGGGNCSH